MQLLFLGAGLIMDEGQQHLHCDNCVSRRCMTRPETGVSCDLIRCPLICGAVFHSCKADEHRILCPLERVPCLNSGFGCPFTVVRNKIAEHLEMCPASVVCCTMEWNRWPVSYADRKSYENLSKDVDEVEQLDMALALQDQRMLLESLKVATMMSKAAEKMSEPMEQISVKSSIPGKIFSNAVITGEKSYSALYQATVETTRSLTAALDILNNATREIGMLGTRLSEANCETEDFQIKEQTATECLKNRLLEDQGCSDEDVGAVGGGVCNVESQLNVSRDFDCGIAEQCSLNGDMNPNEVTVLCNGFHMDSMCSELLDQSEMELDVYPPKQSIIVNGTCMILEEDYKNNPLKVYNSLPVAKQQLEVLSTSSLSNGAVYDDLVSEESDMEQMLKRKLEKDVLSYAAVFAQRPFYGCPYSFRKMEDKAVDTSDLEITEDPMGLQGIDLITAALLFCLGDSPGGRGISDSRYVDGYHVDFGTQTFSLPSALLATNTMVGEIASASACDHANPQLSNPSPFQALGLDLVLECVARYQTKQRSMFTFVCGQLFRRNEFSSHFKNVHGDIHAGLNGWMEQRCPLAYYGCTYSQRRFCPSTQGSKIIHDRHLRSFGVQPHVFTTSESTVCSLLGLPVDHLSSLPFEVLQHIAGFLDGFSLCQLSRTSRLMRDICASLLQARGMVILLWEKRQYPNGSSSWQIKDKVWRFSTAFCTVRDWKFADIISMADHLKKCSYNTVEKREDAIPLPCMCVTRELTKEGRSLRSVLKPVL
ncbi:F-box only protein 30 isoform X2 [Rhinatrema bivittatum]|uniref:F-box only protein 30 isoform X2 n=1 Tax=Rhinatrema bivittatum TaxID=194408 RepID=UPI00112D3FFE|nr:F-box only protein 30 isoform X2 [Rhinatrema bivittatum]